jgi:hypothetical protein
VAGPVSDTEPLTGVRETVTVALLPSATVRPVIAVASPTNAVTSVGRVICGAAGSSFRITPNAVSVTSAAATVGLESWTLKVSSVSIVWSPAIDTVMVLVVSPSAKVTLPLGSVPPKSVPSRVSDPLTCQSTVSAPDRLPDRVTVKV